MLTLYFLALLSIVQYSFVKHRAVQPVFACSWQNWGLMTRASKKKRWHINSKVNYAIIHNKTIFFERETRDRERQPHFVVQASLEHSNAQGMHHHTRQNWPSILYKRQCESGTVAPACNSCILGSKAGSRYIINSIQPGQFSNLLLLCFRGFWGGIFLVFAFWYWGQNSWPCTYKAST